MKARHNRPAFTACTAIALLWASTPVFAQDDASAGEEIVLERVEVEGAQPAGPASDTPLATQTTADDIARQEIDSIADLGNTTEPGLDYSKRTDTVVIRGMSGPRVATVIDGIPIPFLENFARGGGPTGGITNADGGGSSFDFSSLSALDVLRGADSSRVGSGVLGGALVLRTLEPEDLLFDGRNWGGLTKLTYDSEDNSVTGALAIAGRAGNTTALFQGSYKIGEETQTNGSDGSYGRSRTKAEPADLDQHNLLFKLRHDVEGGHRIGITAERFERNKDVDLVTAWNVVQGFPPNFYYYPVDGYFAHDDVLRERVSLDYNFESPDPDALIDSAFAVAYWQQLTLNAGAEGTQVGAASGAQSPYMRDNELQESGFGFVGGMTGQVATGSLDHQWRLGVDIYGFNTSHFIYAVPDTAQQADIPEVDGMRLGIFLDNRIAFADSGFALTPGLRFDWHEYRPKETPEYTDTNVGHDVFGLPDKHSDHRFSPKILATYDVTPQAQLFAQWSAAYRAPTVNELYLNFTNPATGYAQLGNADLKPETGHGIEIGANIGTEYFGGRVALFHNRYRNFIDTTPLTPDPNYPDLPFGIGKYINIDKVEISGVELSAHKLFDNGIRLHGGLTYAYGRNVVEDTALRSVAPLKAVAGIGYQRENWGVDLTGIFAARMKDDGDPATFDAPGYSIANLTAWWEPEQVEGMRIQVGVYNIFDTTYYNALNVRDINLGASSSQPREFYSEPGRSFKVSLTQRF